MGNAIRLRIMNSKWGPRGTGLIRIQESVRHFGVNLPISFTLIASFNATIDSFHFYV